MKTLCALLAVLVLTGCATSEGYKVPQIPARAYQPSNVYSLGLVPEGLVRVAVLPAMHPSDDADIRARTDATIRAEMGKTRLFELSYVSRAYLEENFGEDQYDSAGLLPDALLERIRTDFAAEGVLFTDVTLYDPYRPVAIGLRSKLVDLRDGEIVWVFDDVLDGADPGVQSAVFKYAREVQMERFPQDSADSMLHSPNRFFRYVAHSAYNTLPKR